jgi:p-aminobenzoyl-glutamate transporter AbgT
LLATLAGVVAAVGTPHSRLATHLGLHPPNAGLLAALAAVSAGYLVCLCLVKAAYQRAASGWL